MYTRHNEVPVFEYREASVDATYYNHVQTALKRLGASIRLALPQLKTLDLILQTDAWIIVDRALNDLPVAAWADFQARDRGGLHEPVRCRVRLYNAHAGMLLTRVLEAMELLLGEQLGAGNSGQQVVPFRKND